MGAHRHLSQGLQMYHRAATGEVEFHTLGVKLGSAALAYLKSEDFFP